MCLLVQRDFLLVTLFSLSGMMKNLMVNFCSTYKFNHEHEGENVVLLCRDEKLQLLFGMRRANRQQPALSSSVLSSDSMHIGILAAAAHAATNNSPFTIFCNPR